MLSGLGRTQTNRNWSFTILLVVFIITNMKWS